MSETSDNWKIQYNVKAGESYQDLINIRATDLDDLDKQLAGLSERADVLGATAAEMKTKLAIYGQFPNAERVEPDSNPPASGDNKTTDAHKCAHGVARIYKSGPGGNGKKPWGGWFCVVKNDPNLKECEVDWDRN